MTHQDPAPHADRDGSEEPLDLTPEEVARLVASARDEPIWPPSAADKYRMGRGAAPAPDGTPPQSRHVAAGRDESGSGKSGTSRPEFAREERLRRYEDVLAEHRITGPNGWGRYGCESEGCDFDTEDWTAWEEHVAPHLVAVADAEQETLRAEVERLRAAGLRHIDYFKAMRERAERADKRAEAAEAEIQSMRRSDGAAARDLSNALRRAASAEAERDRLTRLLGSHADGHRCTCAVVRAGTPGVEPDEWEQDPWCPTHPDVDQIKPEFDRLARVVEQVRAEVALWPSTNYMFDRLRAILDSQAPTEGGQP